MAIWFQGKKLGDTIAIAGKRVSAIYYKGQLIWQAVKAILSCFGSGVWLSSKPWIGTDTWKNNS